MAEFDQPAEGEKATEKKAPAARIEVGEAPSRENMAVTPKFTGSAAEGEARAAKMTGRMESIELIAKNAPPREIDNKTISQDLLRQVLRNTNNFTTDAKFYSLHSESGVPTYPSIFVDGNAKIETSEGVKQFSKGAIVFEDSKGKIQAVDADAAMATGGVTVEGGRVRPRNEIDPTDPYREPRGNIATMQLNDGRLKLTPGDGRSGFSIPYPASTPQTLVEEAYKAGKILDLKDESGKIVRGFFTNGEGGILPNEIQPLAGHTQITGREFLVIGTDGMGRHTLFPYKEYTDAELKRLHYDPGNKLSALRTLDGEPVNRADYPSLDIKKVPVSSRPDGRDLSPLHKERAESRVNELIADLPKRIAEGQASVVKWAGEFAPMANYSFVRFNRADVLVPLEAAGYKPGAESGNPNIKTDKETFGRYVVGEFMSDLNRTTSKSGLTYLNVEAYENFKAPSSSPASLLSRLRAWLTRESVETPPKANEAKVEAPEINKPAEKTLDSLIKEGIKPDAPAERVLEWIGQLEKAKGPFGFTTEQSKSISTKLTEYARDQGFDTLERRPSNPKSPADFARVSIDLSIRALQHNQLPYDAKNFAEEYKKVEVKAGLREGTWTEAERQNITESQNRLNELMKADGKFATAEQALSWMSEVSRLSPQDGVKFTPEDARAVAEKLRTFAKSQGYDIERSSFSTDLPEDFAALKIKTTVSHLEHGGQFGKDLGLDTAVAQYQEIETKSGPIREQAERTQARLSSLVTDGLRPSDSPEHALKWLGEIGTNSDRYGARLNAEQKLQVAEAIKSYAAANGINLANAHSLHNAHSPQEYLASCLKLSLGQLEQAGQLSPGAAYAPEDYRKRIGLAQDAALLTELRSGGDLQSLLSEKPTHQTPIQEALNWVAKVGLKSDTYSYTQQDRETITKALKDYVAATGINLESGNLRMANSSAEYAAGIMKLSLQQLETGGKIQTGAMDAVSRFATMRRSEQWAAEKATERTATALTGLSVMTQSDIGKLLENKSPAQMREAIKTSGLESTNKAAYDQLIAQADLLEQQASKQGVPAIEIESARAKFSSSIRLAAGTAGGILLLSTLAAQAATPLVDKRIKE